MKCCCQNNYTCCDQKKHLIGSHVPRIELDAYHEDRQKKIRLSDYLGNWVILFFYPADFTFVCPTELRVLGERYEDFKKEDAEILSVSTDTVFVHKAWHDASETIANIAYPMIADPAAKLSRALGVYLEDEGMALRATFIINPEGIIKSYTINHNDLGRSIGETLRTLQAAKFVRERGGEVCPVEWKPGDNTLKPGMDLVGKI